MQSMNISLPDPLKQFVDGQIARGRYSSAIRKEALARLEDRKNPR